MSADVKPTTMADEATALATWLDDRRTQQSPVVLRADMAQRIQIALEDAAGAHRLGAEGERVGRLAAYRECQELAALNYRIECDATPDEQNDGAAACALIRDCIGDRIASLSSPIPENKTDGR